MENTGSIAVLGILSTVYVTAILVFVLVKWKEKPYSSFIFASACSVFIWQLCNTLFYIIPGIEQAAFFHELKYLGNCFSAVMFLLMVFCITGKQNKCRPKTIIALSLIPAISVILALTNRYHGLFKLSYELIQEPVRAMVSRRGIWFYLKTFYGYSVSVYSICYLIYSYLHGPSQYFKKIGKLILAASIPVIVSIFAMLNIIRLNYDISLLAVLCSLSIIIWTEYFSDDEPFMFTRDIVFDSLSNPIFILDSEGMIIDSNRRGRQFRTANMKKGNKINSHKINFQEWLQEWTQKNKLKLEIQGSETFISGENSSLKIHQAPVLYNEETAIGSYVEISNITAERLLMRTLQELASIDSLTKLFNRAEYEKQLQYYEENPSISVSLYMIDINSLKLVNDIHGHALGDKLITTVAGVLKQVFPARTGIFRIGGDEFTILMEDCSEEKMLEFREEIMKRCSQEQPVGDIPVSVSIGFSVRNGPERTIEEVSQEADKEMYRQKSEFYKTHNRRTR
ncbi:diguanylate cyclase [Treponema sp. OttesenSCG-928-L16]|nr:diguanylate cyclase [Treponema sp. OttesenSCG-928-L16]